MINLSFSNISDEIFALSALRARQFPEVEIPRILSRDQLPALRIVIRAAFSQMVSRLIAYVSDASTDEANPPSSLPYSTKESLTLMIDFGSYTDPLSSGSLLILRRQLEHMLAVMTLSAIFEGITTANKFNCSFASEIDAIYQSIISFLSLSDPTPILTVRQYA